MTPTLSQEYLKGYFHQQYQGIDSFMENILRPIFGQHIDEDKIDIFTQRSEDEAFINAVKRVGITGITQIAEIWLEHESNPLYVFDICVKDSVQMQRNRVAIQSVIHQILEKRESAFMIFHYENSDLWDWRFTFCHKSREDGETTDKKRYTFVLGPNQSCRTVAQNFEELAEKGGNNIRIADIKKAFDVEALSKEFFEKYKQHYERFVSYITGKRFVKEKGKWVEKKTTQGNDEIFKQFIDNVETYSDDFDRIAKAEKAVRDYIKKMLGRIVFLHFIQKKGWLGVLPGQEWGTGDQAFMHNLYDKARHEQKANFLDAVLEPIFEQALNTDRSTDGDLFDTRVKALPNEGRLRIPYLNGGLFERDEDDRTEVRFPTDYFSDLFEFFGQYNFTIDENDSTDAVVGIDPEMLGHIFENLLEDNKDKGAFYTPKEIVAYMCRESIISYLNNDEPEEQHPVIRNFVETLDASALTDEHKLKIRKRLQAVKICDPAIGSGAFPMGLVNLLSKLYLAMKPDTDTAKMKRHIMEQNIYGVDIEKGAVDIARLRFWLSMIVDEPNPQPLPNLHFKIMQGNSLLESYEGKNLADLASAWSEEGTLDFEADEKERLQNALKVYYNTTDHTEKERILNDVLNNIRRQVYNRYNIVFPENFDPSANDKFFLWHTWFSDVFEKGGFDIVIGNPPYIQLQANGGELGKLYDKQGYETYIKTGDIYSLFYEKGWQVLKQNGHLCFITSNKWMRAGYGEKTRNFFATKTDPELLIDFAGTKIFQNATVDTNILLFSKAANKGKTNCCTVNGLSELSEFISQNGSTSDYSDIKTDSWVILSDIERSIKSKIEAVGIPLKDWDIQINYGIKTGFNDAFIIDSATREEILAYCSSDDERQRTDELIRPILRGKDIKRYSYDKKAGRYLINCHNGIRGKKERIHVEDYPTIKAHLDKFWDKISKRADKGDTPYNLRNCAYLDDFYKPKIVYPETTQGAYFAYDEEGMFIDKTCFMLISPYALYLQKVLSSKLFEVAYKTMFSSVELGEHGYQYNKHALLKLPVIMDQKIIHDVEQLDDLELINEKINSLYNFTNEEIEFINKA